MIGTIAAILTTLSFLPQAYQVIKTKDTSGISLGMYTMFVLGVFLWIIHQLNWLAVMVLSLAKIIGILIVWYGWRSRERRTTENRLDVLTVNHN